ncbi:MAG TPA: hypothetical protein PKH68_05300 [Paludibacteraceae bacterium]|jgi:hypothetical protein|nr:hypothetical protein [Paludibacteraceae bacterium]
MFSSQKTDVLFTIYNNNRTVYTFSNIALLTGESNAAKLSNKLNYYVHSGKLLNPRKGIYAKNNYNPEELACLLYTPSYISLEYVLQKAGVIFQYDEKITAVSYLSRTVEIDKNVYQYRKIKNEILIDMSGIIRSNNLNIATPERAFLDVMYLNASYYFDNINSLNKNIIYELLPVYNSKILTERINNIFKKNG